MNAFMERGVDASDMPINVAIGVWLGDTDDDYRLAVRVQHPDLIEPIRVGLESAGVLQSDVDFRYIGTVSTHKGKPLQRTRSRPVDAPVRK
jgi:hypothetical protein